eukprot:NODE_239_length_11955_cov_0.931174.p4 type:complete len:404 gc:universal NODE_239_length_11955_cov_0.931174:3925-2714(-)
MLRDQRNVKSKEVINQSIQVIKPYCPSLGDKQLKSPTLKEFTAIFQMMYRQLNPLYQYKKRIQEDMVIILKQLKYPNIDQVKQHLNSPGASQSWPYCLQMLVFLHDLIVHIREQTEDTDPTLEYLINCYQDYIQGEDDFSGHFTTFQNQLMEFYNVQDVREMQRECEFYEKELQKFQPELPKYKETHSNLLSDLAEFEKYMEQLREKENLIQNNLLSMQNDINNKQEQLDAAESKLASLEILPTHDHLIAQKESLSNSLNQSQKTIEKKNNSIWELEIQLQKVTDELDRVSQEYMQLTYSLPDPKPISVNFATGQVEGPIALDAIFQSYSEYKLQLVGQNHAFQEQITTIKENIEKIAENIAEMEHDISTLQDQLKHFNQHYEHHRKVFLTYLEPFQLYNTAY